VKYFNTYEEVIEYHNALGKQIGLTNVVPSMSWKCGDGEQIYDANDLVYNGPVVFISDYDAFWAMSDEGQRYESAVLKDPTYTDLLKAADESISVTKDSHHCYLEGTDFLFARDDGTRVFRLVFGS
jgi:hypothetical protein